MKIHKYIHTYNRSVTWNKGQAINVQLNKIAAQGVTGTVWRVTLVQVRPEGASAAEL